MSEKPILPCKSVEGWTEVVEAYAKALEAAGPSIGAHGLDPASFEASGLFKSAVERLRGQQAASLKKKQGFIDAVLTFMQMGGFISKWEFVGSRERHDYEVSFKDGRLCCIEAKGCLDGNNTNIFKRPGNADEFVIWSLCQNPGADPRRNAWSGIHTRLSAEIVARKERVDGLVIWDMLCGTLARPCPKIAEDESRATLLNGKTAPPPCIFMFPRTVPDPRNNPNPKCWGLRDIRFLEALAKAFKVLSKEVVNVEIQARMDEADVQRRTLYTADEKKIFESSWTTVRRAS